MNQERLLQKTEKVGDCLIWQGKGRTGPYGVAGYQTKHWLVHRLAYHLATGEILSSDDVIRHTCDTPLCVNSDHLRKGTHQENVDDKVSKNRHRFGENHPLVKLTLEEVDEVRRLKSIGTKHLEIAHTMGISETQVSRIVNNKRWNREERK